MILKKEPQPLEKREEEYREVSPYDLKDIYSPPDGVREINPMLFPEFNRVLLSKDFTTTHFEKTEIKLMYYDARIATNLYLSTENYEALNSVDVIDKLFYIRFLPELSYARLKKSEYGLLIRMIGKVLRVSEQKYGSSVEHEERGGKLRSLLGLR